MATKQSPVAGALTLVAAVGVAAAVSVGAADGAASLFGVPAPLAVAALAFAIQWVAFVPAYLRQTERFYDLVGSLTYLSCVGLALVASGLRGPRAWLLGVLVMVWAIRLGTFLFRRVHADGGDGRFDAIKPDPLRFLVAWSLQGLWVVLTLSAAIAAITTTEPAPLGVLDGVGLVIWLVGFGVEVVADRQKRVFRRAHPGRFIDTGLWAWSRHPNYFGEIVLWTGVATVAASTLRGWQWVTMISPLFVLLLLTRVSGVPILERRSDERWGADEEYRRYKSSTSVLVPWPPKQRRPD